MGLLHCRQTLYSPSHCSFAKSCPVLYDTMDYTTPGSPLLCLLQNPTLTLFFILSRLRAQLPSSFLSLNQILFCPQLEIFLSQRAVEMSEEADILSVSQFQLAPAILQGQTKAKVVAMVSALQDLIGRLTSLRMQHLFMILASPRSGFPLDVGLFQGMLQGAAILGGPASCFLLSVTPWTSSLPPITAPPQLGLGVLFGARWGGLKYAGRICVLGRMGK